MSTIRILEIGGVRDFMQKEPRSALVNVLTPAQHARWRIPGSKQACVFETVFLDNMAQLAPDKTMPVLLYGAGDSMDSTTAAEKLLAAGYTRVYIVPGGIQGWREAGYPLEGDAPQAPESDNPPYPPVLPAFRKYTLLPEKSRLAWVGRADNHQHWGSLGLKSGSLSFKGMRGSGRLVADMKAIRCDDLAGDKDMHSVLLAHLFSEDFFLTRLFPEAAMEITELSPKEGPLSKAGGIPGAFAALPNYHGRGLARIRNKEDFIEGDLSIRNLDDGMLSLAGQVRLDRTRWGVLYGSARFFRFLNGHKVDDIISLDAMLLFQGGGEKNAV